jgi:hypothetical protein
MPAGSESPPFTSPSGRSRPPVVFRQTLPFTCGPAALLSVLISSGASGSGLGRGVAEVDLWRESTAVACPGSHPLGLALAAERRGFRARLAWQGSRPWLWSHIRSEHALLRKSDYLRIETAWLDECQRHGTLTPSPFAPCEGGGLLLVTASGPKGSDRLDPHWVGLWKGPRGVYLLNPLRKAPQPCPESAEELWSRSGFQGTRCWLSLEPNGKTRADWGSSRRPAPENLNRRTMELRKRFGRSTLPRL